MIIGPKRVRVDIRDDDGFFPISARSARAYTRTDVNSIDRSHEIRREAGCYTFSPPLAIAIQKQNRTLRTAKHFFNQPAQRLQDCSERIVCSDQFENFLLCAQDR